MKKNTFKIIFFVILLFIVTLIINSGFLCAVDNIVEPSSGTVHSGFTSRGYKIWNTVKLILQIGAITLFIFTGVKYMYASADQKADLKKGLGMTFIGVVLVFGLTFVVDFVQNIATDLF